MSPEQLNAIALKTIDNRFPSIEWLHVPENPRKAAVAYFKLLTGHDSLRYHVYRIGIADSLDCTLCDSGRPMTAEHLEVCPVLKSLNSIVEKYRRSRALMV
ncbi:hypothetical protein TNCV_4076691 [Trichonephila clavipes]|nr:hypothetical protein TNCV_4076691 [Trichonephila clavipes]